MSSASAAEASHCAKDLERLLLSLQQRRSVCPEPAEGIPPLSGPGRGVQVEAVRWRIEEDGLAVDLLDHSTPCQHLFERVARRETPMPELQVSQLCQRVVLIAPDDSTPILSAEIAKEEHQNKGISLVAAGLQKTSRGDLRPLRVSDVSQVFALEESFRLIGGNPRLVTPPGASRGQIVELQMKPIETLGRQPVDAVVHYPGHG